MALIKVAFVSFFLCLLNGLHAQIEFQLATSDVFDNNLSSQKDFITDMNGDYLDDVVLIINSGLIIYYQNPNGAFERKQYLIDGILSAEWNAVGGDFNADGYTDLAIGRNGGLAIIIYDPIEDSFNMTDLPDNYFVQRTTGVDIDLDGDLDLFSCNDNAINQIFENDGNGNFVSNINLLPTVDLAGNYSNVWCDYDNDGDQDLQISKCYAATINFDDPERINLFYNNNGDGTFTEVGESINMNDNAQTWVTNMEDFDNDGDFDAFIANHDQDNRFMLNDGTGHFTDIIGETGLDPNDQDALESFAHDFDNNGFIDIILDTKKRIWLNNGDLTFTPVAFPMFMFNNGSIGDLNNDGFLDLIVGNGLWFNRANENNWIKINAVGIESNLYGIGSRVEIFGSWGKQTREIRAGRSFSTMSSLTTHFGLGEVSSIDSLVITWPTGMRTTKINPQINTTHLIQEIECVQNNVMLFQDEQVTICEGEVLELSVPLNTYEDVVWSDGTDNTNIEISEAGIYFATMIDPTTGCFITSNSVTVDVFTEATPSIFPNGQVEICGGDTLFLIATVEADDFMWNTGETSGEIAVSEVGEYFVQSTSVCTGELFSSEIVEVLVVEAPAPIVSDISIQSGESITLTAEGEGILWYSAQEGGNVIEVGPEFITPYLTIDITFYVASVIQTTNGNICVSERVPVNVFITSVEELFSELGVNVFPNPADTFIQIDIENTEQVNQITLINELGQEITSLEEIGFVNKIDVLGIPSGNYYLQFDTSKGFIAKSVVVKK